MREISENRGHEAKNPSLVVEKTWKPGDVLAVEINSTLTSGDKNEVAVRPSRLWLTDEIEPSVYNSKMKLVRNSFMLASALSHRSSSPSVAQF
jgi:hypothetical protein